MTCRSLLMLSLSVVLVVELPAIIVFAQVGEMVWIPGGTFEMGDHFGSGHDAQLPVHTVTLDGFWLGRYEVTNAEYCVFLNEQGNQSEGGDLWLEIGSSGCLITESGGRFLPKGGYEVYPVVEVTWYGNRAYCEWAGGRLPTEAEWEYAARGGLAGKRFPWGDDDPAGGRCNSWDYEGPLESQMAHLFEARGPLPVGSFDPNGYGLYDMAGNVWECCSDWYDTEYYSWSPAWNPTGPPSGSKRAVRGGSWHGFAAHGACAARGGCSPSGASYSRGLRLCRTGSEENGVTSKTWGAIKGQF